MEGDAGMNHAFLAGLSLNSVLAHQCTSINWTSVGRGLPDLRGALIRAQMGWLYCFPTGRAVTDGLLQRLTSPTSVMRFLAVAERVHSVEPALARLNRAHQDELAAHRARRAAEFTLKRAGLS